MGIIKFRKEVILVEKKKGFFGTLSVGQILVEVLILIVQWVAVISLWKLFIA